MRTLFIIFFLLACVPSSVFSQVYPEDVDVTTNSKAKFNPSVPFETMPTDLEGTHYPDEWKWLQQSNDNFLKVHKAYMAYNLNVLYPGYKKSKVAAYLHNGNIIPLRYIDWSKDFPVHTKRPLDFALSGKFSFFVIKMPNGGEAYTQDGRFFRDVDGLLKNIFGYKVAGVNGDIYLETDEVVVNRQGDIFLMSPEPIDRLKTVTFKSANGLWTYDGSIMYIKDKKLAEINNDAAPEVLQGYLEGSNEYPGMLTGSLHVPLQEGQTRMLKSILDEHEVFIRAVGPE